MSSANST